MRLILTAIILTMLAQSATAEDVYYCTTSALVGIDENNQPVNFNPERFKMLVTNKKVKFGSGSMLESIELEISDKLDNGTFWANDKFAGKVVTAMAEFGSNRLDFALIRATIVSLRANCDKF